MANTDICLQSIKELITSCFVPPLKEGLDEVHLQSEQFDGYRKQLELHLPILFDLLQQNKQYILECKDQQVHEILANLIVLLYEISSPSAIYRLSNESLQRNVDRILKELIPTNNMAVENHILNLYQEKVGKTAWKKQLGSLHSFLQFIQLQYSRRPLPEQWANFCLSVSLNLRDSHEPLCKRFGILIFNIILTSGDYAHIEGKNIHNVIYDSAYRDVDFIDSTEAAEDIWKCLYKCLDFFKELNSFNWSHLDDLMEKALKNVTLAPNNQISLSHLQYVRKLGAYFAINKKEIETYCDGTFNDPFLFGKCRNIFQTNNSYTIFRWAKSILNLFINNAYKLMQDKQITQTFLMEIHKCYLVFILPIQLEIIRPHLIHFIEKFTSVLLETIVSHKFDKDIIEAVQAILETFRHQLQHSTNAPQYTDYLKIYEALGKLLKQNLFTK